MYQCTIITDAGSYSLNVAHGPLCDDWVILSEVDAWEFIKKQLEEGRPFKGDDGLFSIEPGAKIIAITVNKAADLQQQETTAQAPDAINVEGFNKFGTRTKYLGQPLFIEGTAHTDKCNFTHYMPTTVNNIPFMDAIEPAKLRSIMLESLLKQGRSPGTFKVVVPAGDVQPDDEIDYLTDYIEETSKPVTKSDGGAKAWDGGRV